MECRKIFSTFRFLSTYSILFVLSVVVLNAEVCKADAGPEPVIKEIIAKLKETGSPIALMDYIHWESVLETLPPKLREQRKLTTAAQLKAFYSEAFDDPAKFMAKQLEENISKVPADRQALARQHMATIIDSVKKKMDTARDQVRRTEFEIGKVQRNGDKADVEVIGRLDGTDKRQHLNLKKVDGKWLLTTLDFGAAATSNAAVPTASPPAATTPSVAAAAPTGDSPAPAVPH